MKNWIKIPKSNIKTAIIAGIVLFALTVPKIVWGFWYWFKAGNIFSKLFGGMFGNIAKATAIDIGHAILTTTVDAIHWVLHWFARAGAEFLNGMIRIGFDSHFDIVKAGWEVTRNFSNMFFILFLVIVAFATILRFEKYGIKQLLPKVILIALLINFSFVIAAVIVDFSNITANFFISDIKKYTGKGFLSGEFVDSLNLLKTNITLKDCQDLPDTPSKDGGPSLREECKNAIANISGGDKFEAVTIFVISSTVGSIVLLIAAFTFFAGGILLLIRIVVIWFLLMIVPLAFLCYIMPGLRKMWQTWWKTFLKWCFFAPAYAFFLWLALKISIEGGIKDIADKGSSAFDPTAGPFSTIWTATPGNALIHYFFVIALLLGGLIAASKFGIYGADVALKVGQKMYKGAGRWTGARIRERTAEPAAGLARGMAKVFGRVPGLKKLAQAPTKVMTAQRKDIEKEKKNWASASMDTLKSLYPTVNRTQQIAFAQLMSEKGKFSAGGNFKNRDVENIMKVANIYGKDMVAPMLTNRPDLAPAIGQTVEEAIKKISPAKAEKIQTESFKDKETLRLIFENFRGGHLAKIAETNVGAADEIQKAIRELSTDPNPAIAAAERETRLAAINPKLTIYINNTAAKGTGDYTFD